MRRIVVLASAILLCTPGSPVNAQEQILYRYDALGRLVKTYRQAGPAAGMLNETQYDAAGNRSLHATATVVRTLPAGQSFFSPDGRFRLVMQGDGNLVLYFGSTVLWVAPNTYGTTNTAIFQIDGNFVVYGPSGPLWASGIYTPGAKLHLQNDGNLVIYSLEGVPVWATGTGGH